MSLIKFISDYMNNQKAEVLDVPQPFVPIVVVINCLISRLNSPV